MRKSSYFSGFLLIALGLVFLATTFFPQSWPNVILMLGAALVVSAVLYRRPGLLISGAVNLTLGAILLYQALTGQWASWYFLWPLLPASVGLGMIAAPAFRSIASDAMTQPFGTRYWVPAASLALLGLLFAVTFWVFRPIISWPSMIWGVGLFFLLMAFLSPVRPLAIPGAIIAGIGLILAYQKATGDWASWAYTWALIPGLVGLGLVLAFLRRRVVRIVGLSLLAWSLVVFSVFGLIFGAQGRYVSYWPAGLILAGLAMLVQSALTSRPFRNV